MPDEPAPLPLSERSTLDLAASASAGSFGRYKLLQRIGEGGMGEVWVAEQTEPVRRQVALKVIKAGMDSAQVVARFEAERQALALMDHPVIATVFDGGTTPQGRPYFAMEYVKGEPITLYCDRHRLSTKQRLELFMQACEGVQHAHQKGIIHRDLKPSNVLVTIQGDQPLPKIIDFGVAKATSQPLTERSLFTELGVLIGTPEYMSPEQAEMGGLDVDTRTDIYALGVLLYELLTGSLPFDRRGLRQAGLGEIQRIIREKEPPRPSTRITQLGPASAEAASNRRTEPRRLVGELRGDLDWITMLALEKDRTRRYQTANALAADVRRHLSNEPVTAGPPSTVYRARKFVRRHRFGVAVGAAAIALLVGFSAAISIQAAQIARQRDRANAERDRANREAEAARGVTDFLVSLFKVSDPAEARGRAPTAREILDRGADRIGTELENQPELQARLLRAIGTTYIGLGLFGEARALLERALAIQERVLGPRDLATIGTMSTLGVVLFEQGELQRAEGFFRRALEGSESALGSDHPDTRRNRRNLCGVLLSEREYAASEAVCRQVVESDRRVEGPEGEGTLTALSNLAVGLAYQGRLREAEATWRETLEGMRRRLGPDSPKTLDFQYNVAWAASVQGRLDEARPLYLQTRDAQVRVLGPEHPNTLQSDVAIAEIDVEQGQTDRGLEACRRALVIQKRVLPRGHPTLASTLVCVGEALNRQGRFSQAQADLEDAIKIGGASSWSLGDAKSLLGESLAGQRAFARAEPWLLAGHDELSRDPVASRRSKQRAAERIVALYEAWGKPEKASEWRAKLGVAR